MFKHIFVESNDSSVKVIEKTYASEEDYRYSENTLTSSIRFIDYLEKEEVKERKVNELIELMNDEYANVDCYISNYWSANSKPCERWEMIQFIQKNILNY